MKRYLCLMIMITIIILPLYSIIPLTNQFDIENSGKVILTEETQGDEEAEDVYYVSLFHSQLII